MSVNSVYYAIDMGAPSAQTSGFFCWRFAPKSEVTLNVFRGPQGWTKSIESISRDARKYNVCIVIEAALWGLRQKSDNAWIRRFHLKSYPTYTERPWYIGAGAATGLMAQQFLTELAARHPERIVKIYESYISGLVVEGTTHSVQKPSALIDLRTTPQGFSSSKHGLDALEGLFLLTENQKVPLKLIVDIFRQNQFHFNFRNKWMPSPNSQIHIRETKHTESFGLGLLSTSPYFDLQRGEILFTRRCYDFYK